ncbi:hypothetical protein N234_16195 [Ralstonia pickettii DTP0602]|nr:hypothetical protein N234_16195 [Ralstonia pickettii DTP0602]
MEFANREFGGMQGYARVYAVREWVRNHVRFLARSTNERTSAADAIVKRTGVCRDFAHLMIALCRALSIPARMSSSLDYGSPEMICTFPIPLVSFLLTTVVIFLATTKTDGKNSCPTERPPQQTVHV